VRLVTAAAGLLISSVYFVYGIRILVVPAGGSIWAASTFVLGFMFYLPIFIYCLIFPRPGSILLIAISLVNAIVPVPWVGMHPVLAMMNFIMFHLVFLIFGVGFYRTQEISIYDILRRDNIGNTISKSQTFKGIFSFAIQKWPVVLGILIGSIYSFQGIAAVFTFPNDASVMDWLVIVVTYFLLLPFSFVGLFWPRIGAIFILAASISSAVLFRLSVELSISRWALHLAIFILPMLVISAGLWRNKPNSFNGICSGKKLGD
jgi:hypothetical protein